jgi:hypothetical protein
VFRAKCATYAEPTPDVRCAYRRDRWLAWLNLERELPGITDSINRGGLYVGPVCSCAASETFCQSLAPDGCCLEGDICNSGIGCVTSTCSAGNAFCTLGWATCNNNPNCACFSRVEDGSSAVSTSPPLRSATAQPVVPAMKTARERTTYASTCPAARARRVWVFAGRPARRQRESRPTPTLTKVIQAASGGLYTPDNR